MAIHQNPTGIDGSGEPVASESPAAAPAPDAELTPRCGMVGPDSWDLFLQGNFFCSLPRGHDGLHYEEGAPRKWWDYE